MPSKKRFLAFIAIFQSVLFLAHFFLYETWRFSSAGNVGSAMVAKVVLGILSMSFIAASLLAFRYTNIAVRTLYRIAAIWLGLFSFLFFAAILSWIIFGLALVWGHPLDFHLLVE